MSAADDANAFQKRLGSETWALYGVGAGFILLRTYARIHRLGLRGLQPDDYIMLIALTWYTMLVSCLNIIASGGGSNLFRPEEFDSFTQKEMDERVTGSKIVIVSEQAMLNTIYTIKACMLFMYMRLTSGLRQQKYVKGLAVYVACGWLASELAYFINCRPFTGYWAVPPPNPECTTLKNYAIVQATFNISSDLLMMIVMLPLLAQVNLPVKQRVALLAVFGLGSFVIIAAVLTKYFNLSDVYSTAYMFWYVREASTAVFVSNLPMIWPLLREWFPYLRSVTPGHRSSSRSRLAGLSSSGMCGRGRSCKKGTKASVAMSHISKSKNSTYTTGTGTGTETDVERTGSAERINKPHFDGRGILAETTVDIDIDEGSPSLDTLDLEKQTGVPVVHGSQHPDRMRYEWDSTPSGIAHDSPPERRGVTIQAGKPADAPDRKPALSRRDSGKSASHWRIPSMHGALPDSSSHTGQPD